MDIQTRPPDLTAARPRQTSRPAPPARAVGAPQGKIEVSAQAIASLAGRAVAECYGVVGIVNRRRRFGAPALLPPERYHRGIEVRFVDDHVTIGVSVVLEYGLRISEVARNLIKDVKYTVEHALGLPVVEVHVNVEGLRISRHTGGTYGT